MDYKSFFDLYADYLSILPEVNLLFAYYVLTTLTFHFLYVEVFPNLTQVVYWPGILSLSDTLSGWPFLIFSSQLKFYLLSLSTDHSL